MREFRQQKKVFRLMLVVALLSSIYMQAGEKNNIGNEMLCTVVRPISWQKILPETKTIAGQVSKELEFTACRGEFEPGSFVLRSSSDIRNLRLYPTDLKCGNRIIKSSQIDIKWVKCWYQTEAAWVGIAEGKRQPVLVPELLLKDDLLVKVDYSTKKNYLRLSFPDKKTYVDISDPKIIRPTLNLPNDKFPVIDSRILQPINLKKGQNKQVWVTLHVPNDTSPGVYTGAINVTINKKIVDKLTVKVTVLPFKLAEPGKEFSLYYHGKLTDGKGAVGTNIKNETQLRAELENMRNHGVKNPMFSMTLGKDQRLLNKYLKIRKKLGMTDGPLYFMDGHTFYWDFKKKNLPNLFRKTREIVKLANKYGFSDAYIYGVDEAKVEFTKGQHSTFETVHKAGGKVFQAGYWGTVDVVGDLMDLQIYAGTMSRDQARKWHAKGNKVFNYGNPQIGVENPWIFRHNYGILLYHYEYDGVMLYAYQHGFGHPWNDFDAQVWRDHMFTYPTSNGVIDTIAWEGFREAVDDVRYLTTLDQHLEDAAIDSKDSRLALARRRRNDIVRQAQGTEDHDKIRQKMIKIILALDKMPKPKNPIAANWYLIDNFSSKSLNTKIWQVFAKKGGIVKIDSGQMSFYCPSVTPSSQAYVDNKNKSITLKDAGGKIQIAADWLMTKNSTRRYNTGISIKNSSGETLAAILQYGGLRNQNSWKIGGNLCLFAQNNIYKLFKRDLRGEKLHFEITVSAPGIKCKVFLYNPDASDPASYTDTSVNLKDNTPGGLLVEWSNSKRVKTSEALTLSISASKSNESNTLMNVYIDNIYSTTPKWLSR